VALALLLLTLYWVFSPLGWDLDEAAILWNAQRVWDSQQSWTFFSPEFTKWEMLTGYFYTFVGNLGLPLRLAPLSLRLVEVSLLFCALRRERASLFLISVALIFYSLNSWNLYYGDILGTCVGVVLWTFLLPKTRSRLYLYFFVCFILQMHYTSLRLLLLWEFVVLLRSRDMKRIAVLGLSVLSYLAALALNGEFSIFLLRGAYNIRESSILSVLERVWASLFIGLVPLSDKFSVVSTSFMGDFVHEALRSLQEGRPLWGWGAAMLFVLGCAGRALECKRVGWKMAFTERDACLFFVWGALSFLGPSASRLLLIQGLVVLFLFRGWQELFLRTLEVKIWTQSLYLVFGLLSALVMFEGLVMLKHRSALGHQNVFFFSRYVDLSNLEGPKALVMDYGFPVARWIAENDSSFLALPATSLDAIESLVNSKLEIDSPLRVYFDQPPAQSHEMTGGLNQWQSLREAETFLRSHFRSVDEGWHSFSQDRSVGLLWVDLENLR